MVSLKHLARSKILTDMIKAIKPKNQWKVLVVDHNAMRIISACCRMFDIMDEGVTLVENVTKQRKPLREFEAIYFMQPTEENFEHLFKDFATPYTPQYAKCHLFLTSACPDDLFKRLSAQPAAKFLGSFEELNMDFVAAESHVFSLDKPSIFHEFYSPTVRDKSATLSLMAEKIVTALVTLGENPVIRFSTFNPELQKLGALIKERLSVYRAAGEKTATTRPRGTLVLIDRGLDFASALLHELTYQAMAYDLLPIENDIYRYEHKAQNGAMTTKEVVFDEADPLWPQVRHLHIADAIRFVSSELKKFAENSNQSNVKSKDKVSLEDLADLMKKMPQYQEAMGRYQLHVSVADKCMECYNASKLENTVGAEQNMVKGEDSEGNVIKSHIPNIVPILQDSNVDILNKLRVLMLFIIVVGGVSQHDCDTLLKHASVPELQQRIVANMKYLKIPVVKGDAEAGPRPEQRKRNEEGMYSLSRWTPLIKSIMEDAAEGKLSKKLFGFLDSSDEKESASAASAAAPLEGAQSLRWTKKAQDKKEAAPAEGKSGPLVIVFQVGNCSYSEMRCAYEVSRDPRMKSEVILGSTGISRPIDYLEMLKVLDKPLEPAGGPQ